MNKYMALAVAALITACGDNEDIQNFEKKQATIANEIAAQQAEKSAVSAVDGEENAVEDASNVENTVVADNPCTWAGLTAGCKVTSFGAEGSKLYAVETAEGDVLTTSANAVSKATHNNFTNYVEKSIEFAKTQGKELNEADIKQAVATQTRTQRGFIVTLTFANGAIYILEDGRIMGKLN